jgi:ElaB/YqjD/DUF883 family membrane-anchored ribosome-binding protein
MSMAYDITADIKDELASLRTQMNTLMTTIRDMGAEGGQKAYESAREVGQIARDQAIAAHQNVGHYIEERPYTSVIVAFGTGLAVGTLLAARR